VIEAFDQRASEGVQQVLWEAAARIEVRGKSWKSAMQQVEDALAGHYASAPDFVRDYSGLADFPDSARAAIVDKAHLGEGNLKRDIAAFADGWTSPQPKSWRDRHPFW